MLITKKGLVSCQGGTSVVPHTDAKHQENDSILILKLTSRKFVEARSFLKIYLVPFSFGLCSCSPETQTNPTRRSISPESEQLVYLPAVYRENHPNDRALFPCQQHKIRLGKQKEKKNNGCFEDPASSRRPTNLISLCCIAAGLLPLPSVRAPPGGAC